MQVIRNFVIKCLAETRHSLTEGFSDTMVFRVYSSKVAMFLEFLKKNKTLKVTKKTKDGGYYDITVLNTGPAENFSGLVKFYREKIKI